MSRTVQLEWGKRTDLGNRRKVNEDAMLARPPVFLVADGMGGYEAGDRASAIVAEEFATLSGPATASSAAVAECLRRAEARITALNRAEGMTAGSTLAAAILTTADEAVYWLIVGVGDSRIYRFCDDGLEQLNHDHSVVQELLDAGVIDAAAARAHPQRHVITRAVGAYAQGGGGADYGLLPLVSGDRLLVCSDGLTHVISDDRLARHLASRDSAQLVADGLVAAALRDGSPDNITAIVVDVVDANGELVPGKTRPRLPAAQPSSNVRAEGM